MYTWMQVAMLLMFDTVTQATVMVVGACVMAVFAP
jgi:hypothetical protein